MAFALCCFGKSRRLCLGEEDPDVDLGQLKRFSLRELQVAANGFSDKNFLARGVYGRTYKGHLEDGSLVAIKRLEKEQTRGQLQFQTEIKVTSITAHPNILRVCGFCMRPGERLLVYSYMVNGSVASWLRDRQMSQPPLNWHMRKRIALDSARGVAYLHSCNPKIIHRNITAAKIFLDEEFRAVVGGLGWGKLLDREHDEASTIVCGTVGYIAPEYLYTGRCSEKIDVYAYGMMLLEIVTGQKPFDLSLLANNNDLTLLDWIKGFLMENKLEMLVDSDLRGDYVEAEAEELIQITLICTQSSPEDRPTMSEVVRLLNGNGLEERWNEYNEREIRRDELDYSSRWSFDSAESLYAEDLPGPR